MIGIKFRINEEIFPVRALNIYFRVPISPCWSVPIEICIEFGCNKYTWLSSSLISLIDWRNWILFRKVNICTENNEIWIYPDVNRIIFPNSEASMTVSYGLNHTFYHCTCRCQHFFIRRVCSSITDIKWGRRWNPNSNVLWIRYSEIPELKHRHRENKCYLIIIHNLWTAHVQANCTPFKV